MNEPRSLRPAAILATCCLSLFLVTMDVTIVNVALPSIKRDLDASVSGLQWSIDGYTVVVASFLMLAGSMADRFGRRRVFQIGLTVFSLGSLLCSLAPTIEVLVAFRMVQAIGGAMLNPVAMSIITNTFTEPRARARAIGVWGAVVGISMALGPLLGGILTQTVGWRSIFWINVPIGIAAILLTRRFVPESRAAEPRRVDPVGQVLVVIALAALTSATIEGPDAGWSSPLITAGFAIAATAIVVLIAYERRRRDPLIDLRFFQSIPFAAATIMAVLAFTAFSASLFLDSLYLQDVRHLRPWVAGFCLLPVALAMIICSPLSGRLVGAGRGRLAVGTAGVAMAIGALLLVDLDPDTSFVQLIAAFGAFGIGMGLVNAPITNAAVSGMPRSRAGVASAFASTSRQVGASLGVALAGTIAAAARTPVAFSAATHPMWWIIVANGVAVVMLGILSTSKRAAASTARIAHLLD